MARLAAPLLAFAVAVSTTALAHGRDLPTQIKLTNGGGVVGGDRQECVYTVYVRTGSIWKAGTDANITLELYTEGNADGVAISDLPSWGGLMRKYLLITETFKVDGQSSVNGLKEAAEVCMTVIFRVRIVCTFFQESKHVRKVYIN
ncbi:hypothetical protein TRIUR3_00861 [Triticum urartu]|uniref:PLAT domain-containing protein n=1 Tax=Triticum urartu TaxID=4572 RepID=M8A4S6_TRIUA|nr:hypothetical protein TRIUR3_00861 [Triticum urartu]